MLCHITFVCILSLSRSRLALLYSVIVYQQRRFRLGLSEISCVSHRQSWVLPHMYVCLECAKPALVPNMFVRKFPKHILINGIYFCNNSCHDDTRFMGIYLYYIRIPLNLYCVVATFACSDKFIYLIILQFPLDSIAYLYSIHLNNAKCFCSQQHIWLIA